MRDKHPVLILEITEDFPEPSEDHFLEFVIKKTDLNEAELWTVRADYNHRRELGSTDFYWDRVPTKEEKVLSERFDRCLER